MSNEIPMSNDDCDSLRMTTRGISTPSSASASMMFQYPFSFQQETVLSDRILQLQYHRQYHRYESPQRQVRC